MEHSSYEEFSVTMLDMDALPVGRHQWRIENNICNQGETSIETLLISGCQEDQYTCDDGKCLNINQRCNNIEVSQVFLSDYSVRYSRIVMMSAMKKTAKQLLSTLKSI